METNYDESMIFDLLNDDEFFENEFQQIKNVFPMEDCQDIRNFLKNNPGVIIILNNVKPLLDKYVPYAKFHLRLDDDPLFTPQLQLMVKAHKQDFENGFKEDIMKINYSIRPLISKLNLFYEFFVFDGMIHEDS